MSVNHRIDASRAHFVNQVIHLSKVCIIILARGIFYGLPHDTESHEVEAPLHHILNILIIQGVLGIECSIGRWDIRCNLVNYIDTMENGSSSCPINHESRCCVDCDLT